MLQDIDIRYVNGALVAGAPLSVPGLTVAGINGAPPSGPLPGDHNLIAWVEDPAIASTSSSLVNGTLYLTSIYLRAAATISKVWWINTTAAVTPTAGQNFVGLYSSAGNLLSSAGIDSIVNVNGSQSASLAAVQPVAAGHYWVAILVNAGTPPAMARLAGASASANNINLTAATYRFAANGTGQTTLPSSITPGSNTTTGSIALWAAVS